MFNKLYVRFLLILTIVALCGLVKACYPLKEGIDLAGGVDLVYELDLSKMPNADPAELAKRVIETLQKRVDPYGQKNLTWRVVGKSRIEIQMPRASEETRQARAKYNDAQAALQATNLKPAAMEAAFRARAGAVDAAHAAQTRFDDACQAAGLNPTTARPVFQAKNQAAAAVRAAQAAYDAAAQACQNAGLKPAAVEAALGATDRAAALAKLATPGSAQGKALDVAAKAYDARAAAAAKLAACENNVEKLAAGAAGRRALFDQAAAASDALDQANAAVSACERELDTLATPGSDRRQLLEQAADAYAVLDKADAATRKFTPQQLEENAQNGIVAAKLAAEQAYNALTDKLMADNIPLGQVNDLLEQGDNPKDTKVAAILDGMLKKVKDPTQHARFAELIAARENLRAHQSGGFDDPNDLKRLLQGQGILDFRIAADPATTDPTEREAIKTALDQFHEVGPRKAVVPNMRWFEVDAKNGADLARPSPYYVTALAPDGNWYILLYTDWSRALYHSADHPEWRLTNAQVQNDENGKVVVAFEFDSAGGTDFAELTTSNVHRAMAILLDNRVVSAPNINTPIIQGRGVITFGDVGGLRSAEVIQKEAETLVQMLEAGSLPAALGQQPVSETTMSPSFGEDNIRAGKLSGIIAVLAVMGFMLVYYTLTGSFADLALMINLLMTLAIMSLFGATLTLPGIAGIVLTLGMAVDANVLINERIREEVHRGSSLWMAVRQGYDKVFWTIFDANTTTSLTSIVLIFVGSAEVKGFGVTLLIGLMVHMFTALFVTRTFMIAAVKWGILRQIDDKSLAEYLYDLVTLTWLRKGEWPFMRVVTVSNFDWIGKRHIFWTVSGVLTIAGIFAFIKRGPDKYDTEFRAGTQVVFRFNEGHGLKLDQVRQRVTTDMAKFFHAKSKAPGDHYDELARDMEASNVVELGAGAENQKEYKVVTAVSVPADVKEFRDELVREFSDVLPNRPVIHFADQDIKPDLVSQLVDENHTPVQPGMTGIIRPIDQRYLDEVFPGLHAPSVTEGDLSDMRGGVAIYLQKIDPPSTAKEMADRIMRMRDQPDKSATRFRDCRIIPITYAAAPAAATSPAATNPAAPASMADAPLTSAVVVSSDPNITYSADNDDQWRTDLAKSEWDVVRSALSTSDSLEDIQTVDSVVADTARTQAMVAVIISLGLIIIYVWIRFGGLRYGIGAILSLVHDAIMAVAATVLSGWIYGYIFGGKPNFFLINDFKINLTMIAAYLTIIGYSVNDTIVIFDRIRENRGRAMLPLTSKLVNDSINQCFGRTIWTTFTVFIVVLIMYIFGGEGVHGFSFAMLVGVFTGAYSTLAIASPALLSVKERARSKAEMMGGQGPAK